MCAKGPDDPSGRQHGLANDELPNDEWAAHAWHSSFVILPFFIHPPSHALPALHRWQISWPQNLLSLAGYADE
jgi:hypothetical protein